MRVQRDLFAHQLHVDLPEGQPFPAGTTRYPFQLAVPPWVPPSLVGNDCTIENVIETRLDVDWAVDPSRPTYPVMVVPPEEGVESTLIVRSPANFHESIVVEVTLQSSVVAQGQPFVGHVALRGGHAARFDAVNVRLASIAVVRMGRGDVRRGAESLVRIPAERLRQEESVPFLIPSLEGLPPTFRNDFLEHGMMLDVSVEIPWASDPSFNVPLQVLPCGSTIRPTGQQVAVGAERLQLLSASMARATGLRPGRLPTLVEGAVEDVGVRIPDGSRRGGMGIDVDLTFPDIELGIHFRPLGVLEGFRESPLLPEPLRAGHLLRFELIDAKGRLDDVTLEPLVRALLEGLAGAEEVRLTDHHLGFHVPLKNDGSDSLDTIARFACDKARAIVREIRALPFPAGTESARPAWQATASEQLAVLVPTGPSLHGVTFRNRILGGEERVAVASLCTRWKKDGPVTVVDLDVRAMPLTKASATALEEADNERLRSVRVAFPEIHLQGLEHVVLERPGFTSDPRSLFSDIESFVSWVLESRDERRVDAPYR